MTYLSFLQTIETYLKNTTVSGVTLPWYSKICLEDEIELSTGTTYPSIHIVPIPFDLIDDMMVKYGCKIYLTDEVTRAPNYQLRRIIVYSNMIQYLNAFIQQLPDEYICELPITINPIVRWDANIDGIYFEFILNNSISCL